jgi:hypothetical protein
MHRGFRSFIAAIIIIATFAAAAPVGAISPIPMPAVPLLPPMPGPQPSVQAAENLSAPSPGMQSLSGLKAVLVVGPIDGDNGSWTTDEKAHMELAAAELEANGVSVHRFYTPNNDWAQIAAAAQGAQFFLYRGHGVYWPPPDMPSPPVGGLALKNRIISSDEIRSNLHLAPGAIVMLYACFSAGTSSLDTSNIGSTEARRRVAQYSDPFMDIGASGYYANWYGAAFQTFIRYLFQGKTLGQAYEAYFDFDPASVERYTHPSHSDQVLWLDKNLWSNYWQYSNAFAGFPGETLSSLFDPNAMVVDPHSISYLTKAGGPAKSFELVVGCTGSQAFNWTATIESSGGSWIDLQPLVGGLSGQSTSIILDPAGMGLGTYNATIRILSEDPAVQGGDQTIPVQLKVTETGAYQVFLPLVMR